MGGMDKFTTELLLTTATSGGNGNEVAAGLYKELNKNQSPAHVIAQSHTVLKALGYKIGAIVESHNSIGEIIDFRNNTGGFYDGLRYPVTIKGPNGTFEQSIFVTHYEDVPKYRDNPQQLLIDFKDDIMFKVVTDIDNVHEVMSVQSELSNKKNIYDLVEFLDLYEHPVSNKTDYVYKYALATLEKQRYKELNLIRKAGEYIESEDFADIQNEDAKVILEDKYYSRLSYYNDNHKSFGTPHNDILSIYSWSTGTHKEKIKQQLIDRCSKMDDIQLYAYASLFKGIDIEQNILSILEQRM